MLAFKFEHLHIMDFSIVDMEAQRRTDNMEPLDSGSARIDGEHVIMRVAHDLENVRMSAYEDVRTVIVYKFPGTDVITAWISADMRNEYPLALAHEKSVQRLGVAQVIIVTVSRNAHQRFELPDFFSQLKAPAEVSGMPDLINRLQKLLHAFIKNAVCI